MESGTRTERACWRWREQEARSWAYRAPRRTEGPVVHLRLDDTSPLLARYRSTLSVRDTGNGTSVVDWVGAFERAEEATEEAAAQVIDMIYETGLSGLETTLAAR